VLGRVFLTNRALLGCVLLVVGLQLAVLYMTWLQAALTTVPLSGAELLACARRQLGRVPGRSS